MEGNYLHAPQPFFPTLDSLEEIVKDNGRRLVKHISSKPVAEDIHISLFYKCTSLSEMLSEQTELKTSFQHLVHRSLNESGSSYSNFPTPPYSSEENLALITNLLPRSVAAEMLSSHFSEFHYSSAGDDDRILDTTRITYQGYGSPVSSLLSESVPLESAVLREDKNISQNTLKSECVVPEKTELTEIRTAAIAAQSNAVNSETKLDDQKVKLPDQLESEKVYGTNVTLKTEDNVPKMIESDGNLIEGVDDYKQGDSPNISCKFNGNLIAQDRCEIDNTENTQNYDERYENLSDKPNEIVDVSSTVDANINSEYPQDPTQVISNLNGDPPESVSDSPSRATQESGAISDVNSCLPYQNDTSTRPNKGLLELNNTTQSSTNSLCAREMNDSIGTGQDENIVAAMDNEIDVALEPLSGRVDLPLDECNVSEGANNTIELSNVRNEMDSESSFTNVNSLYSVPSSHHKEFRDLESDVINEENPKITKVNSADTTQISDSDSSKNVVCHEKSRFSEASALLTESLDNLANLNNNLSPASSSNHEERQDLESFAMNEECPKNIEGSAPESNTTQIPNSDFTSVNVNSDSPKKLEGLAESLFLATASAQLIATAHSLATTNEELNTNHNALPALVHGSQNIDALSKPLDEGTVIHDESIASCSNIEIHDSYSISTDEFSSSHEQADVMQQTNVSTEMEVEQQGSAGFDHDDNTSFPNSPMWDDDDDTQSDDSLNQKIFSVINSPHLAALKKERVELQYDDSETTIDEEMKLADTAFECNDLDKFLEEAILVNDEEVATNVDASGPGEIRKKGRRKKLSYRKSHKSVISNASHVEQIDKPVSPIKRGLRKKRVAEFSNQGFKYIWAGGKCVRLTGSKIPGACETRTVGLVFYPSPRHPTHELVRNHLLKLRWSKTKIDSSWAKFAASAVLTANKEQLKRERFILPVMCPVRRQNYFPDKSDESVVRSTVNKLIDEVVQRESTERNLKKCSVVLERRDYSDIAVWCMEHRCYHCNVCNLSTLQIAISRTRRLKKGVFLMPGKVPASDIVNLMKSPENCKELTIDIITVCQRSTFGLIGAHSLREWFLSRQCDIWSMNERVFVAVHNSVRNVGKLNRYDLPEWFSYVLWTNTPDKVICFSHGQCWELLGLQNSAYIRHSFQMSRTATDLDTSRLRILSPTDEESTKWLVFSPPTHHDHVTIFCGEHSIVLPHDCFERPITRVNIGHRKITIYTSQQIFPFRLLGPCPADAQVRLIVKKNDRTVCVYNCNASCGNSGQKGRTSNTLKQFIDRTIYHLTEIGELIVRSIYISLDQHGCLTLDARYKFHTSESMSWPIILYATANVRNMGYIKLFKQGDVMWMYHQALPERVVYVSNMESLTECLSPYIEFDPSAQYVRWKTWKNVTEICYDAEPFAPSERKVLLSVIVTTLQHREDFIKVCKSLQDAMEMDKPHLTLSLLIKEAQDYIGKVRKFESKLIEEFKELKSLNKAKRIRLMELQDGANLNSVRPSSIAEEFQKPNRSELVKVHPRKLVGDILKTAKPDIKRYNQLIRAASHPGKPVAKRFPPHAPGMYSSTGLRMQHAPIHSTSYLISQHNHNDAVRKRHSQATNEVEINHNLPQPQATNVASRSDVGNSNDLKDTVSALARRLIEGPDPTTPEKMVAHTPATNISQLSEGKFVGLSPNKTYTLLPTVPRSQVPRFPLICSQAKSPTRGLPNRHEPPATVRIKRPLSNSNENVFQRSANSLPSVVKVPNLPTPALEELIIERIRQSPKRHSETSLKSTPTPLLPTSNIAVPLEEIQMSGIQLLSKVDGHISIIDSIIGESYNNKFPNVLSPSACASDSAKLMPEKTIVEVLEEEEEENKESGPFTILPISESSNQILVLDHEGNLINLMTAVGEVNSNSSIRIVSPKYINPSETKDVKKPTTSPVKYTLTSPNSRRILRLPVVPRPTPSPVQPRPAAPRFVKLNNNLVLLNDSGKPIDRNISEPTKTSPLNVHITNLQPNAINDNHQVNSKMLTQVEKINILRREPTNSAIYNANTNITNTTPSSKIIVKRAVDGTPVARAMTVPTNRVMKPSEKVYIVNPRPDNQTLHVNVNKSRVIVPRLVAPVNFNKKEVAPNVQGVSPKQELHSKMHENATNALASQSQSVSKPASGKKGIPSPSKRRQNVDDQLMESDRSLSSAPNTETENKQGQPPSCIISSAISTSIANELVSSKERRIMMSPKKTEPNYSDVTRNNPVLPHSKSQASIFQTNSLSPNKNLEVRIRGVSILNPASHNVSGSPSTAGYVYIVPEKNQVVNRTQGNRDEHTKVVKTTPPKLSASPLNETTKRRILNLNRSPTPESDEQSESSDSEGNLMDESLNDGVVESECFLKINEPRSLSVGIHADKRKESATEDPLSAMSSTYHPYKRVSILPFEETVEERRRRPTRTDVSSSPNASLSQSDTQIADTDQSEDINPLQLVISSVTSCGPSNAMLDPEQRNAEATSSTTRDDGDSENAIFYYSNDPAGANSSLIEAEELQSVPELIDLTADDDDDISGIESLDLRNNDDIDSESSCKRIKLENDDDDASFQTEESAKRGRKRVKYTPRRSLPL